MRCLRTLGDPAANLLAPDLIERRERRNREAVLNGDRWIVDLPPTGGPIYADGNQGRYGIDRDHPEVERQKRIEAAMGKSVETDIKGD